VTAPKSLLDSWTNRFCQTRKAKGDYKMNRLLSVNIRQFEIDEDFSSFIVDGEVDTAGIIERYGSENEDNSLDSDNSDDSSNTETNENSEELDDSLDNENETEDENETETENENETEKQKRTPDEAFAEMRRQLEANEPLAKWVQDLATQQGFKDPQELITEYEKQQIAREAEEKGVPVDVYQRLHYLEQENKTQRDKAIESQFNAEVVATKSKHNLSEEQLTKVFDFMNEHGYGAGSIPFEHAYMLANSETLIKDAEERGRQQYLEEKQKLQKQATPNIKTHAKDTSGQNELDMSTEAIFAKLDEFDIDY